MKPLFEIRNGAIYQVMSKPIPQPGGGVIYQQMRTRKPVLTGPFEGFQSAVDALRANQMFGMLRICLAGEIEVTP